MARWSEWRDFETVARAAPGLRVRVGVRLADGTGAVMDGVTTRRAGGVTGITITTTPLPGTIAGAEVWQELVPSAFDILLDCVQNPEK